MTEEIIVIEYISCSSGILESLKLSLCSFSIVQLVVIACFEVNTYYRVGMQAKVNSQDVKTDIIIIHLVVAKGNVYIDCMKVFVFYQELFIDLSCLLEVASEVVKGCHAKLVLNRVCESTVIIHNLVLITHLLGELE